MLAAVGPATASVSAAKHKQIDAAEARAATAAEACRHAKALLLEHATDCRETDAFGVTTGIHGKQDAASAHPGTSRQSCSKEEADSYCSSNAV